MESLPQAVVEQIVAELPSRSLKKFDSESSWYSIVDWAVNHRLRYRVEVFLPPGERTSIFYKLEVAREDAQRSWVHIALQDFLTFPERYLLESVSIVGQPYIRAFKRKNFYCVEPFADGALPTSLQILLSRPFASGTFTSLRLSALACSYRHLPLITRLIRREFQIFSLDDVSGHPLVVQSILTGSVKSSMLRKIAITSAECGDNICRLVRDVVCQPQFRDVRINSENVDFDLGFFRAVFRHWQNLRECPGRVSLAVPSTISEYANIKQRQKGRTEKQMRKTAHFNIFFTESYRFGYRQQMVQITYT